eukprot:485851-Amphidinium_carterae.1
MPWPSHAQEPVQRTWLKTARVDTHPAKLYRLSLSPYPSRQKGLQHKKADAYWNDSLFTQFVATMTI